MNAVSFKGKVFYIQKTLEDGQIIVTCSDFVRLWRELLTLQGLVQRFKDLNSFVRSTPTKNIVTFISNLNLCEETIQDILTDGKTLKIEISTLKCDYKLSYFFQLNEESPEMFYDKIMRPFLFMLQELKGRQDILINTVEAKDKEIQEYQLEGGTITRKHIVTTKFEKCAFLNERLAKLMNEAKSQQNVSSVICEPENLNLYCSIQKVVCQPLELEEKTKTCEEQANLDSEKNNSIKKKPAEKEIKKMKNPRSREREVAVRKKWARKEFFY